MITKKQYLFAEQFLFAVIQYDAHPLVHWHDDRGWIYFQTLNKEYHLYISKNKKLLDAIWNSVVLVRHAVTLVQEAK